MTKMSPVFASSFFAQAAAPAGGAQPAGGGGLFGAGGSLILVYGLLFAAMYFFMIAPQRKKQKEHERMLTALQSGDEVVTNGGIYGVITNVKDDRFVVRIADNTKIEVAKGFIQSVVKRTEAVEKK